MYPACCTRHCLKLWPWRSMKEEKKWRVSRKERREKLNRNTEQEWQKKFGLEAERQRESQRLQVVNPGCSFHAQVAHAVVHASNPSTWRPAGKTNDFNKSASFSCDVSRIELYWTNLNLAPIRSPGHVTVCLGKKINKALRHCGLFLMPGAWGSASVITNFRLTQLSFSRPAVTLYM